MLLARSPGHSHTWARTPPPGRVRAWGAARGSFQGDPLCPCLFASPAVEPAAVLTGGAGAACLRPSPRGRLRKPAAGAFSCHGGSHPCLPPNLRRWGRTQVDRVQGTGDPMMTEICMTPPLTELFAKRASTTVQGTVVGTRSRARGQPSSRGPQMGSQVSAFGTWGLRERLAGRLRFSPRGLVPSLLC